MNRPTIFAHRGASGKCFENSMKSFLEAYKQKADGLEIDVQLTEDGVPMVIHDSNIFRLAGIKKEISSMTYAEVKKIRIGRKYIRGLFGHHIPTLHEVANFCSTHKMGLNIELKETVLERPDSVAQIIAITSGVDRIHISSFHYPLIAKVKEISPNMETAFLVRKKGVDWENLNEYRSADGFHLHKRLLTEPYVSKIVSTGKKIRVYGVTGKENFISNPPTYIDGWITDYPGVLLKRKKDFDE
ncbi:glycerophosphodiester phosphodiesterase [Sporosarcina sp. G11-34]|uniref:glycerophosphodiester phosphodiesterase n=1 Tax=Sporosarcina sp. G11-34 TaxID=2849605 RepID=UPI0022A982BA|nr:glycerophosphodiester phosphodiesterase family protein [Sporosarcina sp. G11-34]MCZ2260121.1 hypothetical protein [Sporosarcina sp. G11-34]